MQMVDTQNQLNLTPKRTWRTNPRQRARDIASELACISHTSGVITRRYAKFEPEIKALRGSDTKSEENSLFFDPSGSLRRVCRKFLIRLTELQRSTLHSGAVRYAG